MTDQQAPQVHLPGSFFQRPGSANWWYGLKVPAGLAHLPQYRDAQGKRRTWAFRASLRTPHRAEAERQALQVLQRFQSQWELERRQANPVQLHELAPEVLQRLADYITFCVFHADDHRRDNPKLSRAEAVVWSRYKGTMSDEEAQQALQAPLEAHLGDVEADGIAEWNARRDQEAGRAVARRNTALILRDAEAAAQHLGLAYDWRKPEARESLLYLLEAKRRALAAVQERDRGEVVPTPQEPPFVLPELPEASTPQERKRGEPVDVLKAHPKEVYLRDVFEDWTQHGKAGRKAYSDKTVGKYRRALEWFEKYTDNPSMAAIERTHGAALQRVLVEKEVARGNMTHTTVRDTMINLGTLLNHYSASTGKLASGLFARLTTKLDTGPARARGEWAEEELKQLFGLPVWQRYELPPGKNAGLDAAYWVPLLGLYTGARITELCQLRTDDLYEAGGVWFMRIAETAEGQSVKTDAGTRDIPLPRGLLELGLLEYRKDIIGLGQDWLFPGVKLEAQNNAGGGVSKWFSTLKGAHGFRKEVVFHSFRNSLNTSLVRLGVPIELRCKYLGQKPEGGVNVTHYNKLKPADLLSVARGIEFPFLSLPKVYQGPRWRPGWKRATS